jgi:hypothetical protein
MSFEVILPFLRPIAHLIQDPAITEIMVNGSGRVFVEREGQLALVDQVTVREQNLRVAVRNLARALGDDISEERPLLDSRLPDGSRVAAALLNIVVKIHPNESGTPPSKLADAELHFAGGGKLPSRAAGTSRRDPACPFRRWRDNGRSTSCRRSTNTRRRRIIDTSWRST